MTIVDNLEAWNQNNYITKLDISEMGLNVGHQDNDESAGVSALPRWMNQSPPIAEKLENFGPWSNPIRYSIFRFPRDQRLITFF